jgi:hypothetical protein
MSVNIERVVIEDYITIQPKFLDYVKIDTRYEERYSIYNRMTEYITQNIKIEDSQNAG